LPEELEDRLAQLRPRHDRIPMGRQALALAVLAVVAGGCTIGDDGSSDQDAFRKQADAICLRYAQQIGGIPQPQTFLRDFAVYMRRAVPLARRENRELVALTPPEELADDYRRMLSFLDQQLDLAAKAGEEAFAGRANQAQAAYRQSLDPASEAARIATRIGFTTCGNPGGGG
jgi:hypothetical protein